MVYIDRSLLHNPDPRLRTGNRFKSVSRWKRESCGNDVMPELAQGLSSTEPASANAGVGQFDCHESVGPPVVAVFLNQARGR